MSAALIARAECEVFNDGRVSTDTHFAMLNAGLDATVIEQQIISDIQEEQ